MTEIEPNQQTLVSNRIGSSMGIARTGDIEDPDALLYYQRALELELEEVRMRLSRLGTGMPRLASNPA